MRHVIALAMIISMSDAALAAPPDPDSNDGFLMRGHERWITDQKTTLGDVCCSISDGRPVQDNELRKRDGHYEVRFSREHWPDGDGSWLPVPDDAVLTRMSPLGLPIAWVYHGVIRCLALAGAV